MKNPYSKDTEECSDSHSPHLLPNIFKEKFRLILEIPGKRLESVRELEQSRILYHEVTSKFIIQLQ